MSDMKIVVVANVMAATSLGTAGVFDLPLGRTTTINAPASTITDRVAISQP